MTKIRFLAILWAAVAVLQVISRSFPVAEVWEPAGQQVLTVSALAQVQGRLWAGGREGLFETTDDGVSWSAVPALRGKAITALEADGSRVLAGGPEGLWDGGERGWSETALPAGEVHRLATTDRGLLVATDAGLFAAGPAGSWERLWPAADQRPAPVHSIALLRERLLVGTDDGVVELSRDGAAARRLGPPGAKVLDVTTSGSWVHIAIAGPGGGLARARVGSDAWDRGKVDSEYATAVIADPASQARLFAALGGQATARFVAGVVASEDGGETWAPVKNRLVNSFVTSIALDAGRRTLYAGTLGGGVYRYRFPTPLYHAAEVARPFLDVADLAVLVLIAGLMIGRIRGRRC